MLAVASVRNATKEHEGMDGVDIHTTFSGGGGGGFTINPEEFPEFVDHGCLLEGIAFDDLFNDGGDVLPDLEIDPDILMDFSGSSSATNNNDEVGVTYGTEEDDKSGLGKGEAEVVSKRDESRTVSKTASNGGDKRDSGDKKRKYSSSRNGKNNKKEENNQGKRKVKVDWTPELHRRFVQVVEQLGVDKAVPSRILELMGIDCLTRHNVASHLQKYRSHRKHLLAREAEAASWTHKRHMYGAAAAGGKNGYRGGNGVWQGPTIGFPPPTAAAVSPPVMHHHPHYGPSHVWGHPTVDQSLMQNIRPPPSMTAYPPIWVPPPQMDPYWHQRVPNRSSPGTPCFAQPLAAPTTRFGSPPVPGILPPPHHAMYKPEPAGVGLPPRKSGPPPPADFFPSKESIDAAIGDALTKPWLPLPLGLKPPAVDSVMVELHRHGVSMVPPPPPAVDDEPKKT